jgi:acyl-CoA reductase-like NAD-dependent aldehyde dehydrogenase
MAQHKIEVNRNENTISEYSRRVEQINRILYSYNDLIEERKKYLEYLRTQVNRGKMTKEEYEELNIKATKCY